MKFSTIFSTLATSLSLLSVAASPLDRRSPPALTSHLRGSGTFYRAVTGGELAHVASIYPKGRHPTSHTTMEGDFSHSGGLYVFEDIEEAKLWGSCWAKVQPGKKWALVEFHYTPKTGLKTESFLTGDQSWHKFVDDSYRGGGAHHDIVEGPISVGHGSRMQPYVNPKGQMVWQAAFISPAALTTLVVSEVTSHSEKPSRICPIGCNVM